MVLMSRPSACTASIVQDFTDCPSTSSVHEPHVEVSQPTLVPVSPRCSRMKYTSSVRGSTSPSRWVPFTVKDTCLKEPPLDCPGPLKGAVYPRAWGLSET